MQASITTTVPDWENLAVMHRNREPAHATLLPYADEATARAGARGASPYFLLLNGAWRFAYAPAPAAVPAGCEQPTFDDGAYGCSSIGDHMKLVECIHDHVQPHDEYQAFEVTKRVAWALRGEGAGLLIKTTGENIVPWRGYIFAAGRIAYPDGHVIKVISDVGAGGGNGPSWQDNGYVDPKLYLPALDTTY